MANKIKDAYEAKGRNDVEVNAMDFGSLESVVDEADIILLAPQIGWAKEQVEEDYPDKKTILLTIKEFGSMDGDMIIDRIEQEQ